MSPAAVMIFAAGLGTRMGALTRDRPKPLIPVGGRSLLEDARRDVAPALRAAMLARYRARSGAEAETLDAAAHVLSAQRNLKIVGLFSRLARRDGKPRYLDLLPRVWTYLAADLAHPALAGLAGFVAAHVPAPEPAVRARIAA